MKCRASLLSTLSQIPIQNDSRLSFWQLPKAEIGCDRPAILPQIAPGRPLAGFMLKVSRSMSGMSWDASRRKMAWFSQRSTDQAVKTEQSKAFWN